MLNLVNYLIYTNVSIFSFGMIFLLVKRYTTFFSLNRYLFLFGLCFSLFYPLFHIDHTTIISHTIHLPKIQISEDQVLPDMAIQKSTSFSAWYFCKLVYLLGAGILSCRLIIQFISLRNLYQRSTKEYIRNFPVRVLGGNIAPFSIWKTTFINPLLHTKQDTIHVLEHENVHITQWHFIDILFCELLSIFFWINPIVWILKKSIRENLEFITDKAVLDSGVDMKNYQYSLINVSLYDWNWLGNHFNSSTMKRRIDMINAKRTSKLFFGFYITLIPLCCLALLLLTSAKKDIKKTLSDLPTNFRSAVQIDTPVKPISRTHSQNNVTHVNRGRLSQKITTNSQPQAADSPRFTSQAYFIDNVSTSVPRLNTVTIDHMQHFYYMTPEQFKAFNPEVFSNSTLIAIVTTDSEKGKLLNAKLSLQYDDNTSVVSNLKSLNKLVAEADSLSYR